MGLDMYFYASKPGLTMSRALEEAKAYDELDYDEWCAARDSGKYPYAKVGYLRKANQILAWIEDHVGDVGNCEPLRMTKADVQSLKDDVLAVYYGDPQRAPELLPTRDGFFFGGQLYNGPYFENLLEAADICERILTDVDFDRQDLWFYAWW